jgi:hypothetical protein
MVCPADGDGLHRRHPYAAVLIPCPGAQPLQHLRPDSDRREGGETNLRALIVGERHDPREVEADGNCGEAAPGDFHRFGR